jgi:AraC-like DNA-binding protein
MADGKPKRDSQRRDEFQLKLVGLKTGDRRLLRGASQTGRTAPDGRSMFDSRQINEEAFQYYARLHRVKQYIEQNYSEHISLGQAAMVAGVERKYFSAFFHQKVGVRFRDWLMWVRVNRAKRLMVCKNYSITDIALETGFNDLRTFERKFKICTGTTAREFKGLKGLSAHKNSPRNHDY